MDDSSASLTCSDELHQSEADEETPNESDNIPYYDCVGERTELLGAPATEDEFLKLQFQCTEWVMKQRDLPSH